MRKLLYSAIVAGVALSAGAQTVKIGWFGPETGDSALWGQAEKNTVTMLADDINAKGGIDIGGKKYKLAGHSATTTRAIRQRGRQRRASASTSQDKVAAIIGCRTRSGEAIPVAPVGNEAAKVPLVIRHGRHEPEGHGPGRRLA